jgi:cell division protein FtsB
MPRKEIASTSFKRKLVIGGVTFLFLVLVIASFFGERGLLETYRVQKRKELLIQQTERLTSERDKLLREILELETNPLAVDEKAREKLWLMDPEERVIIK